MGIELKTLIEDTCRQFERNFSAGDLTDLNSITFVLFFLLAVGSTASPFNAFLRSKCFSDGYRWRGLNREDAIPILKTIGLTPAFCTGALASILGGNFHMRSLGFSSACWLRV
jgi:hypothetical protein